MARGFSTLLDSFSQADSYGDLEDVLTEVRFGYNLRQLACFFREGNNVAISSARPTNATELKHVMMGADLQDQSVFGLDCVEFRRSNNNLLQDFYGTRRMGKIGLRFRLSDSRGSTLVLVATLDRSERQWAKMKALYFRDLYVISNLTHRVMNSFIDREAGVVLSARERQCMGLVSVGKRPKQIAAHLELSEHAVRLYLKRARRKIQATNITDAVIKALKAGLIDETNHNL